MSIGNLKHLAGKSRERFERLAKRIEELDARGDKTETRANEAIDRHHHVLDGIEKGFAAIDQFSDELEEQTRGNSGPTLAGTEPASSALPGLSEAQRDGKRV